MKNRGTYALLSIASVVVLCFLMLMMLAVHYYDFHAPPEMSRDKVLRQSKHQSYLPEKNIIDSTDTHNTLPIEASSFMSHSIGLLQNHTHVFIVLQKWQHFVLHAEKYLKKLTGKSIPSPITQQYLQQVPFPHTFFDDFFPTDILEMILEEIPEGSEHLTYQGCPMNTQTCWVTKTEKKAARNMNLPFFTNLLINFMKSKVFVEFIEKVSNVTNLIPDSHNTGSGIHHIVRDGFLKVHADFNRSPRGNDLHRRVNVFLFLNPHWDETYGGHLELWSRELTHCKRILPMFNRLALFNTDDFSYHGHPDPLACPIHRSRRSIAQYYYTTTRPDNDCEQQNCTLRDETKWVYPVTRCVESLY